MHCILAPVHGGKVAWVKAGQVGLGHPDLSPLSPGDYPSPSQGQQLSTESLQQLLERALTPLVDEVKQRGLAPACPSCQRLHKKILVPRTMGHHGPVCDQRRGRGAPGTRILLVCGRMGRVSWGQQVLGERLALVGQNRGARSVWWLVSHRSVIMKAWVMDLGPKHHETRIWCSVGQRRQTPVYGFVEYKPDFP